MSRGKISVIKGRGLNPVLFILFIKKARQFLFYLWILGLALLFSSSSYAVGTVGVRPMIIDLELSPNKKGEFVIDVYSTSPKKDTPVQLSLFDALQKEDGSIDFVQVGKNPYSCSSWIRLEKTNFIVPGGETVTVKGEIFVPWQASGMRIATIMVEPGYEKKKTGITIRVRYAVILRLRIKGRPVIESARLERFGIKKLADGRPAIEAVLFNDSEIDFRAKGQALIQDSSGRIITSINLTTESLEQKKKEREKKRFRDKDKPEDEGQRLYPGSKVAFFGGLDRPVSPGEYTVILTMRYGRRSLTAKEKIRLTKEYLASLPQKPLEALFEIRPADLGIKIPPGGVRSTSFSIINTTEKSIKIKLSLKDIEYSLDGKRIIKERGTTPYSSSGWIELEEKEYIIGPGRSQAVSMKIKVPDSAQPGGRYSQVVIEGLEKTGHIQKDFVEISVIVPGELKPTAEIKRFECLKKDKKPIEFVVDLKNTSMIHILPKARVIIKDVYGNELEEIELRLIPRMILPQTEGRMISELRKRLIPGRYTAYAEIDYGGKEKVRSKLDFVVKE